MIEQKIGFIGCGNMALAIIQGLIKQHTAADNISASSPSAEKLTKINQRMKIHVTTDNQEIAAVSEVLVLAVKPQILPQICQQLKTIDLSKTLIISIAAGITTDKIATLLEQPVSIIRAMPNTPATISAGATGLFANSKTTHQQKQTATLIFEAIGKANWVSQEDLIDVVTAIAGSSPAYVFLFIQAMVEQAIEQGLDETNAKELATQAVMGAAKLAQSKSDESLKSLQAAVTSPGGTTAAAIACFQQNNFSNIVKKAVSAAISRGKELGEQA